jgi:hypothetical protein
MVYRQTIAEQITFQWAIPPVGNAFSGALRWRSRQIKMQDAVFI